MYLSVDEAAAVLGVSAKWVRDRLEAGDTTLTQLKCRKDVYAPKLADRSPVRVPTSDLARYIANNSREHAWAAFPAEVSEHGVEALELKIWRFIRWRRDESTQTPPTSPDTD